ncbi:MAG: nuclear transport factor 2 family protein [Parvibaculum sp.]|uniref:nuclear transport factor 2 family protein n=1 Tax=Parvibaculum sp. TaxID=2024848 RepID=UPI0032EACC24
MDDEAFLVAERFFRAVETGDTDEVARVHAPDARIWHNFSQREQTVEENLKVLRWMARKLPGRHYDVLRRIVRLEEYLDPAQAAVLSA